MTAPQFFRMLILLSGATGLSLLLLHQIPQIALHSAFSWFSCAFFILLNVFMFLLASNAAGNKNKHSFTNIIVIFVMLKMLFSVLVVFGYFKFYNPESNAFLIPFFWIYLLYTIFETYFMTKLGKIPYPKSANSSEL